MINAVVMALCALMPSLIASSVDEDGAIQSNACSAAVVYLYNILPSKLVVVTGTAFPCGSAVSVLSCASTVCELFRSKIKMKMLDIFDG